MVIDEAHSIVHGVIKRENHKKYLGEKDWGWQRGVHKKGRDKRELRKWGYYQELLGWKGMTRYICVYIKKKKKLSICTHT